MTEAKDESHRGERTVARDWDAASYDDLPVPMTRWGATVLSWLRLAGDERVLDAGCGTGQVTALLKDRLPRGTAVAMDASPSMTQAARERLGPDGAEFLVHDLLQPIPGGPYDAVLSTATFHWIDDHDRLFGNLANALRPGGALAAQCGGPGNIARVERAIVDAGYAAPHGAQFPTPEQTARRLAGAGFTDVECWTHTEPTPIEPDRLVEYLSTICLGGILSTMPPRDRHDFAVAVAEQMDEPVIDYVRLNIRARLTPSA